MVGGRARWCRRLIPAGRAAAARLGALAVTVYACGLAGILLLATAAVTYCAGGPPILRTPTATQLAALAYLTIAITALVFIAWYGAMERLGVDRTGLFNGLIPVTSLAAVTLTGTGTITPLRLLGALAVLAGVLLGLSRRAAASHSDLLAWHACGVREARPGRPGADCHAGRGSLVAACSPAVLRRAAARSSSVVPPQMP